MGKNAWGTALTMENISEHRNKGKNNVKTYLAS